MTPPPPFEWGQPGEKDSRHTQLAFRATQFAAIFPAHLSQINGIVDVGEPGVHIVHAGGAEEVVPAGLGGYFKHVPVLPGHGFVTSAGHSDPGDVLNVNNPCQLLFT